LSIEPIKIELSSVVRATLHKVARDFEGEAAVLNLKTRARNGFNDIVASVCRMLNKLACVDKLVDNLFGKAEIDREGCPREMIVSRGELTMRGRGEIGDRPKG
jgi:hypothetical protein